MYDFVREKDLARQWRRNKSVVCVPLTSEVARVPASVEAAEGVTGAVHVRLAHAPAVGHHAVAAADVGEAVDGGAVALGDEVAAAAAAGAAGRPLEGLALGRSPPGRIPGKNMLILYDAFTAIARVHVRAF